MKYYAKPDEKYLNEFKTEEAPLDDFKKGRKLIFDKSNKDVEGDWEKPTAKAVTESHDDTQIKELRAPRNYTKAERFSDKYSKKSIKAEKNNAN